MTLSLTHRYHYSVPEIDQPAPIPPLPPTSSVTTQLATHGKPFLPVTAVAAILLISSLAFGAYQLGRNQTPSSPIVEPPTLSPAVSTPSSNPADPTANWKTFTDNEIGFTFKYPIDRRVQQSPRKDGKFITIEAADPLELISIYISNDPTIVDNFGSKNSNGGPLSNIERVQIDSRDGIKYRAKVNTETNQTAAVTVQVIKDSYSIELVYFQVNEQSDKTFNQILATFKFLDQNDVNETFTIDFSACLAERKGVTVAFGSTTYEVTGKKLDACEINYGGEVENPNWDGKLDTSCLVPISLGKIEFKTNQYGADFSPIKNYCSAKK